MPDRVISLLLFHGNPEKKKLQSQYRLVLKMYSIIFGAHLIAVALANFRQIDCRINVIISIESISKL